MADTIERRTLSLQGAQRVLEAAIGEATRAGLHVSVAVVGTDGQLKAFAAMDGASILSTETARKKALTVIKVGKGTQVFASELKAEMADEPELFHGMLAMDGIATFSPGTWLSHACSDCECCAAERRVAPSVVRSTIGTFHVPPDM